VTREATKTHDCRKGFWTIQRTAPSATIVSKTYEDEWIRFGQVDYHDLSHDGQHPDQDHLLGLNDRRQSLSARLIRSVSCYAELSFWSWECSVRARWLPTIRLKG
jgi:hypothetical protein